MPNPKARFRRYLHRWWDVQVAGPGGASDWRAGRSVEALASEFRRDAQFEVAQAAFLHRRPNHDSAAELVALLVPAPSPEDAEMIVEAIVRAGATAQKVRATTLAGGVLTVSALAFRNVLRGR